MSMPAGKLFCKKIVIKVISISIMVFNPFELNATFSRDEIYSNTL